MRQVFVDAACWIAIVKLDDACHDVALQTYRKMGQAKLVTTDEALTEFLTGLSKSGPKLRLKAVEMVRSIMRHPNIRVIQQSRDSFLRGVEFYYRRQDKEYSLQDCVAMNAMRAEAITEVLTMDRHFEQEGFVLLIKKAGA